MELMSERVLPLAGTLLTCLHVGAALAQAPQVYNDCSFLAPAPFLQQITRTFACTGLSFAVEEGASFAGPPALGKAPSGS